MTSGSNNFNDFPLGQLLQGCIFLSFLQFQAGGMAPSGSMVYDYSMFTLTADTALYIYRVSQKIPPTVF